MNEQPKKRTSKGPRPKQQTKNGGNQNPSIAPRSVSRGAAIRAQKRNSEMANKLANEYLDASATKLENELT